MKIQRAPLLLLLPLLFCCRGGPLRAADDLVPLKIKLPSPVFAGTPKEAPPGAIMEVMGTNPPPPLMIPKDARNIAPGKKISSSDRNASSANLAKITDGDKEAEAGSIVLMRKGLQWIQFDLGRPYELFAVALWHAHDTPKIYRSVIVQAADDEDFTDNVRTLFNNDIDNSSGLGAGTDRQYFETFQGKTIDAKGTRARYVRLYSHGSTDSPMNEYTEVELYGRPAADAAPAQPSITFTVGAPTAKAAIPADFCGLSFETMLLLPGANGSHFFSPQNQPLIALFRTLGIKSLRLGGNTANQPKVRVPGLADIDSLFAFAQAAGVKVIYTLRLREGNLEYDANVAKYIEDHYQPLLTCFAIGNEPDYYKKVYPLIQDYPAYREEWKKFAAAIAAAAPGAKFCGPCAGGDPAWSRNFADDFTNSPLLSLIAQHHYPGASSRRVTNAAAARNSMLSSDWLDHYENLYRAFATTALSNGLPYRLEEANNFSDGGATNVSDTFSAALWSLEYLHWWAAHSAAGVNFHGRRWLRNCVICPVPAQGQATSYTARPIGYGIKAFDLGGHGTVVPLTISNAGTINLTAYAVRGDGNLFVTILNKEHGPAAREATVNVVADGISNGASVLFLTASHGDVSALSGVTLGGAPIEDDGSWHGEWTPLASGQPGHCGLTVPAACAAIVKIPLR